MRTGMNILCMVLAVSLMFCTSAMAGTILFQDDFQSDTAGTLPTTADLDPTIGTGDTGGAWVVSETSDPRVQVLNNLTPDDDTTAAGSNNYARFTRVWYGDEGTAEANGWTDDTTNRQVRVDLDFYKAASNQPQYGFIIGNDDPAMNGENQNFAIVLFGDGSIATDASALNSSTVTFQPGAWQHMTIEANMATKTYSLTVESATETGITWATPNSIQGVWFGHGSSSVDAPGQSFFVDNLTLTMADVPEPSTITLLVVGMFGLLAYAWRKRK